MAKLYLTYDEFQRCAEELVAVSSKLGDGWKERRAKAASNPGRDTIFLVKSQHLLLDDAYTLVETDHSSLDHLMGDESIEEEDDPAIINSSGTSQSPCHTTTNNDSVESFQNSNSQQQSQSAHSSSPPLSVHVEYHIVHSFSYEVPMLYFNATYSSGRQLSLDDTWKLLSKQFVSKDVDRWGLISQQEHPLLHCPFYHIHPCHTATVMAQATKINIKDKEINDVVQSSSICSSSSLQGRNGSSSTNNGGVVDTNAGGEEIEREQGQGTDLDQACLRSKSPNYLITWLSTFGPLVGLKVPLEYGMN